MLLSLVIPCFNEQEVLPETIKQLQKLCTELKPSFETEFIFIDDGSQDETWEILKNYSIQNPRIQSIRLSRNFGHQIASTAGIEATHGDAVVLIDADLQDPPEVIHQMIAKWQEGYDVVYGTRTVRQGETWFKKLTARYFYRMLNRLSEIPIPLDTGDFRLMSRRVVNALKQMPEQDRFIRGMVSWVGFRQIALPYQRHERFAGKTKYSLSKMIRIALSGLLSFSIKPLELSTGLGLFSAGIALVGILYVLGIRLFTHNWISGWADLMIAVLFMGGIQLICVGILGEYIGRIYNEVKNRPLYLIQESVGPSSMTQDN